MAAGRHADGEKKSLSSSSGRKRSAASLQDDDGAKSAVGEKLSKKEREEKLARKEKKHAQDTAEEAADKGEKDAKSKPAKKARSENAGDRLDVAATEEERESKKATKTKKTRKTAIPLPAEPVGDSADALGDSQEPMPELKRKKYIVFVGNLPYALTKEELAKLFSDSAAVPTSVRLLTDKVTKKPRGFAFVEFADAQALEIALSLQGRKIKGRCINVEFTAGGGGNNSEHRKEKIKTKNEQYRKEKEDSQSHLRQAP